MQLKRGLKKNIPTLSQGEMAFTTDEKRVYMGDGVENIMLMDEKDKSEITEQLTDIAINVKKFGAKGNGVTDDTAAIQSAINSLASSGGIVYFPKGVYLCNITITTDGITLRGSGASYYLDKKGTFLRPYDLTKDCIKIGYVANKLTRNILLEDFSIDGFGRSSTYSYNGISMASVWQVMIQRVNVYRCAGYNFLVTSIERPGYTSEVFFSNIHTTFGYKANLKVDFGLSWTTGIRVSDTYMTSFGIGEGDGCCIELDSASLTLVNTYIDVGAGDYPRGIRIYKNSYPTATPRVELINSYLDALNPDAVSIYYDDSVRSLTRFIISNTLMLNQGKIKFKDGNEYKPEEFNSITANATIDNLSSRVLYLPQNGNHTQPLAQQNRIQSNSNNNIEIANTLPNTYIHIKPGNGGHTQFYGGNHYVPIYFEYGANKNFMWLDNSGYLRTKKVSDVSEKPSESTDGVPVMPVLYGTTEQRPSSRFVGMQYFDTTLNKPIWRSARNTWVDANGATV